MKDKLFHHVATLLKRGYCFIMWVVYMYKSFSTYKNLKDIDPNYKKEIRSYWRKYVKNIGLREFRWYQSKGAPNNVRFITDSIFHSRIEPYFNDVTIMDAFSNKCYFNLFFQGFLVPDTIAKKINGYYMDDNFNLLEFHEVIALCKRENEIVIKPAIDSGGGRNITFYQVKKDEDSNHLKNILNSYKSDFVIQRKLKQHEELNQINSSSINTVRVVSFLYHGKVQILSFFLRVGNIGVTVDNLSSGGISINIDRYGHFFSSGYDDKGNEYLQHPSGYVFEGKSMPAFDKIMACVKQLHPRFPYFGLIGWDIAVNENGEPVIIEFNLIDTCIHASQLANGPFFQEFTDEVLDEVFHRNRKRKGSR